jgi:hypothetical protein
MKITYTGEYTSVIVPFAVGAGITCPNGEPVDVPDEIAANLLKNQPGAWTADKADKADKTTKAQGKRAATTNEE